jgi:hypothetical protein
MRCTVCIRGIEDWLLFLGVCCCGGMRGRTEDQGTAGGDGRREVGECNEKVNLHRRDSLLQFQRESTDIYQVAPETILLRAVCLSDRKIDSIVLPRLSLSARTQRISVSQEHATAPSNKHHSISSRTFLPVLMLMIPQTQPPSSPRLTPTRVLPQPTLLSTLNQTTLTKSPLATNTLGMTAPRLQDLPTLLASL